MAFQESFTGKDVATKLPSGEGVLRSQEGMNKIIMEAEKLKYDTFKKNEEEFLKNANIDPVFSLSQAAMKTQAGLIDQFNRKWGKVMQEKGNNLSTEDKTNMATHKSYILEQQARMKSDMDRMQQDMAILDRDYANRYDKDEWYQTHYTPFAQGKPYNPEPLPVKSKDFVEWARSMAQKDRVETFDTTVKNKDGSTTVITRNIPLNQVPQRIKQYILAMPPEVAKNLLNERFIKAPDKQKYLDATDSKENAIIAWAQDQPDIVQAVVNEQRRTVLGNKGGSSTTPSGGDWVTSFSPSSGKKFSYQVPKPQVADIGDLHSNEYYKLPKMEAIPITIKDGKTDQIQVLTTGLTETVEAPPKISGIPYGYDKEHDLVLMDVNKDFSDIGLNGIQSGNLLQIAVPRSLISDPTDVNNIYISDNTGKKIQIGTLVQPQTMTPLSPYIAKPSPITWEKPPSKTPPKK